jgi:hypothetical protein
LFVNCASNKAISRTVGVPRLALGTPEVCSASAPISVKLQATLAEPLTDLAVLPTVRFLAVCQVVAVVALPLNAAVTVPAEKLPEASRATIALAVFAFVAVVAELETLPAVAIVASLVSAIAALALMSAFTIAPAVIAEEIEISALPLKLVAVPVTSPLIAIVLAVVRVAAEPVVEAVIVLLGFHTEVVEFQVKG